MLTTDGHNLTFQRAPTQAALAVVSTPYAPCNVPSLCTATRNGLMAIVGLIRDKPEVTNWMVECHLRSSTVSVFCTKIWRLLVEKSQIFLCRVLEYYTHLW